MITVDMVMCGFRIAVRLLEKIAVSRDKKIQKNIETEKRIMAEADARIAQLLSDTAAHSLELKRADKAAEKLKEFLV